MGIDEVSTDFRVLIIGAGRIGAFFDQPGDDNVLTHAHAFSRSPGFSLHGFIDNDASKAQQAAQRWGGEAYLNLPEALAAGPIDVVCLATPDEYHADYLKELSRCNLKLVFAEKPLTSSWEETEQIGQLYSELALPLAINYSRRYVPEFSYWRDCIQAGSWGRFLGGNVYYGKGLIHNGSHLLDLLLYLFQEVSLVKTLERIDDFYIHDPSYSALLQLKKEGFFHLQAIDYNYYSFCEMELLFEKKRVRMLNSGFSLDEYDVKDNPLFEGYKGLFQDRTVATSLGNAMLTAADNIWGFLTRNEPLLCSLDDALAVSQLCHEIQKGSNR